MLLLSLLACSPDPATDSVPAAETGTAVGPDTDATSITAPAWSLSPGVTSLVFVQQSTAARWSARCSYTRR